MAATEIELGAIRVSEPAAALLERHGQTTQGLLARHRSGDWGEVTPWVRAVNAAGVIRGTLITSRYKLRGLDEVWVLTGGVPRITRIVTAEAALAEQEPWPA